MQNFYPQPPHPFDIFRNFRSFHCGDLNPLRGGGSKILITEGYSLFVHTLDDEKIIASLITVEDEESMNFVLEHIQNQPSEI